VISVSAAGRTAASIPNTILNGKGVPATSLGINGDFYIDTRSLLIYGPKAKGKWPLPQNLQGPIGATGVTGISGSDGKNGSDAKSGTNNANVVGFATLDINDNILVEYEIDIPVSPYAGDLRCKDLQLLKPILRGDRRLSPIIRRGTVKQQAIIIVHPTSLKKLVLPTIPRSLDGVYLCLPEVGLDGELKIPGPVYNDVALDNRVQFPILKIDQMNFFIANL
jgi:hypothetical protein